VTSRQMLLILSLVFLQEGFTYYLSFQVVALFVLITLVLSSGGRVRFSLLDLLGFIAFLVQLVMTAVFSPFVISTNSSSIFLTTIAVLVYAAAIFHMPLLRVRRPEQLLLALRKVSAAVILMLVSILLVSESKIVSFLDREAMLGQNARLIDNFTDIDALSKDQAFRMLIGEEARIDLFYGEPSFLAIVLFTSLGCHLLTSKLLALSGHAQSSVASARISSRMMDLAPYLATLCLLFIHSFSSIIYALVAIYFLFMKQRAAKQKRGSSVLVLLVFGIAFGVFGFEYFMYRLTMAESLSLTQRFGFLFELTLIDMLVGVRDIAKLPEYGIHNGLFYIVAISGVGGLIYLLRLLRNVYVLAKPLKLSVLMCTLMLAILMQNGGVFTPNKVVLFGLILLPLACSRTIRRKQEPIGLFSNA
jgi:hypothetical protein